MRWTNGPRWSQKTGNGSRLRPAQRWAESSEMPPMADEMSFQPRIRSASVGNSSTVEVQFGPRVGYRLPAVDHGRSGHRRDYTPPVGQGHAKRRVYGSLVIS
jgi:hypothetical protein